MKTKTISKVVLGTGIVFVAAIGIVWLIQSTKSSRSEEASALTQKQQSEKKPISQKVFVPEPERALLLEALRAPEKVTALEDTREQTAKDSIPDTTEAALKVPLEMLKKPLIAEADKKAPSAPVFSASDTSEEVATLYFWKDFASLRQEAVRNPDSSQNRATIEAIIQKRKQRLAPLIEER